jgi:hypothetical protein
MAKEIKTMADYIDRKEAIDVIGKHILEEWYANDPAIDYNIGLRDAQAFIKELPAADVTPVVKCEECDHWNAETHGCTRNPSLEPWWESDFCNYWENVRKE